MFSKEEQALAKATVEAIKKIAERQEKECPKCKGKAHGLKTLSGVGIYPYTCETCNGTGKGKWEWEPEVGDWFEFRWKDIQKLIIIPVKFYLEEDNICFDDYVFPISHCTPLLHWEDDIEPILEGMGYEVKEQKESVSQSAQCWIYPTCNHPQAMGKELHDYLSWRQHNTITMFGKTRQEAVQKAVIALVKEKANEKD